MDEPQKQPTGTQPEPWERGENESGEAYAAFCVYRDLSPVDRSLRRAYAIWKPQRRFKWATKGPSQATAGTAVEDAPEGGKALKKPNVEVPGAWRGWAKTYKWYSRARAYDQHLAAIELAQRDEEARERGADWSQRREECRELLYEGFKNILGGAVKASEGGRVFRSVITKTKSIAPPAADGKSIEGGAEGGEGQTQVQVPEIQNSTLTHDVERQFRLALDMEPRIFSKEGPGGESGEKGGYMIEESEVTWRAKMVQVAAPPEEDK